MSQAKHFTIYLVAKLPGGRLCGFNVQVTPIGSSSTKVPDSFWMQLLRNLRASLCWITPVLEDQDSSLESRVNEQECSCDSCSGNESKERFDGKV
jgi:hypothetical protein